MRCRLIDTGFKDGFYNMAVDEALLSLAARGRPAVRFYGWSPPAVSLGYFQREEDFRGLPGLAKLDSVRRLTGGGAIVHDDELTFSVVCREEDGFLPRDVKGSYGAVCSALESGLALLGIKAQRRGPAFQANPVSGADRKKAFFCFEKPSSFDIAACGKKLAGSAQRRSGGAVLHHGSVPISRSGADGSVSAGEAAGRKVDFEELRRALIAGFEDALGAEFCADELAGEEKELAGLFLRTKYFRRPR